MLPAIVSFERREVAALLELAILKTGIVSGHSWRRPFDTIADMREYPALDATFKPSAYIRQVQQTNGSSIIISNVMGFLDHDVLACHEWYSSQVMARIRTERLIMELAAVYAHSDSGICVF